MILIILEDENKNQYSKVKIRYDVYLLGEILYSFFETNKYISKDTIGYLYYRLLYILYMKCVNVYLCEINNNETFDYIYTIYILNDKVYTKIYKNNEIYYDDDIAKLINIVDKTNEDTILTQDNIMELINKRNNTIENELYFNTSSSDLSIETINNGDIENIENIENMENVENSENSENTENSEYQENSENPEKTETIEDIKNYIAFIYPDGEYIIRNISKKEKKIIFSRWFNNENYNSYIIMKNYIFYWLDNKSILTKHNDDYIDIDITHDDLENLPTLLQDNNIRLGKIENILKSFFNSV